MAPFRKTVTNEKAVAFYLATGWKLAYPDYRTEDGGWIFESDRPHPFGDEMYVEVDVTEEHCQLERHNCTICGKKDMVEPKMFWWLCLSEGLAYHAHDFVFPPPIELPKEKVNA